MTRGISAEQEIDSRVESRNIRTSWQRIGDSMESREGGVVVGGTIIAVMWVAPQAIEFLFAFGMTLFFWMSKRKFRLPFRLPSTSGLPDYNDTVPGSPHIPKKASGVAFLGNEIGTKKELWFTESDMRTHLLIFGSTGSGKALRDDELIHTPSGLVRNADIQVGDMVCTPDGGISEVVGVFPQGELSLWRVSFEDGRFLDVSEDHLWGVQPYGGPDGGEWAGCEEVISTLDLRQRLGTDIDASASAHPHRWGVPLARHPVGSVSHMPFPLDGMAMAAAKMFPGTPSSLIPTDITDIPTEQREMFWHLFVAHVQRIFTSENERPSLANPFLLLDRFFGSGLLRTTKLVFVHQDAAQRFQKIAWSLGWKAHLSPVLSPVLSPAEESPHGTSTHSSAMEDQTGQGPFLLTVEQGGGLLEVVSVEQLSRRESCQCIKISHPRGLFVAGDWIVTHNTEALISMAFNSLVQGSGFIYVDGKGDNSLWAKIFSICRSVGREDDLLVLNYMTSGRDVFGPQKTKMSNTMNPFTLGSSGGLTELLVGLMDEAGGDNAMWKGRAVSMISGVMMALVWLRENDGLLLDVDVIRDHLLLENIQKLSKRRDIPVNILGAVNAYLRSLPGYQANAPKQSETVLDQHGYLQMQFTKILGSLSDTYGYIFRTNLGEIDLFDVVVNRRILVVLLPALEKSSDELANLGKIVVTTLKSMMATGLGDTLEGDYSDVIETKPTDSPSPYLCILDEYGYYVVKGAAVMPAQARSLGFTMVFAGQDYPAFKKNNMAEEAVSTIGNCNIKIFMVVEDPTETYDLFKQSVGEALVAKTSGFNNSPGFFSTNYQDGQNAVLERRSRGDLLDLKEQGLGDAHIIFKSTLVRARMFFADPPKAPRLQVNYFLRVEPPQKDEIQDFDTSVRELSKRLLDSRFMTEIGDSCAEESDIKAAAGIFKMETGRNRSVVESGIASVTGMHKMLNRTTDEFSQQLQHLSTDQFDPERDSIHPFRDDLNDDPNGDDDEDEDDDVDGDGDGNGDGDGDGNGGRAAKGFGSASGKGGGEDEDSYGGNSGKHPFLNEARTREDFQAIERAAGYSTEDTILHSQQMINDIKMASKYPQTTVPEDRSPDDILEVIRELDEELGIDET